MALLACNSRAFGSPLGAPFWEATVCRKPGVAIAKKARHIFLSWKAQTTDASRASTAKRPRWESLALVLEKVVLEKMDFRKSFSFSICGLN